MSANIKPKGDNVPEPCVVLYSVAAVVLVVTCSHSDKLPFYYFSSIFCHTLANSLCINLTISTYLECYTHFSSAPGLAGPLRAD